MKLFDVDISYLPLLKIFTDNNNRFPLIEIFTNVNNSYLSLTKIFTFNQIIYR